MSYQWNFPTNNNGITTPGAMNSNYNNYNNNNNGLDKVDKILEEFHNQLSDHKKKQSNLIQNQLASQTKFDEVTTYFMKQIGPLLKSSTDQYRKQNNLLMEEIQTLKAQIASYQEHEMKQQKEKMEMASNIMEFCDRDINPTQFELFVGAIFSSLGYRIEHNGKTHDGGIDLIVRHFQRGKGVIQVKQYRKNTKVTEPQIRDLFGAMSAKPEVEYGIMVVLSDCTKEAKTWPEREGVTNLKIWTGKELIDILKQKGNETLIEFIKLLNDKHENDMKQNSNFVTPKNNRNNHYYKNSYHHNNNYNKSISSAHYPSASKSKHKQRGHPPSSLSSAKKRAAAIQCNKNKNRISSKKKNDNNDSSNDMENMRANWSNFKFSGNTNNDNECKNDEGIKVNNKENIDKNISDSNENKKEIVLIDNDNGNNNNNNNNKQKEEYLSPNKETSIVFNSNDSNHSGEPSPYSSGDSSLLIDESQDSEDENHENMDRERILFNNNNNNEMNTSFSNGILGNNADLDLNTHLLWSLNQNMNKPKKRRQRRTWLKSDDNILINAIKQFGMNWNETTEQWNQIHSNYIFSQQFHLKDIKKHFNRVLKPKILNMTNNQSSASNH